MGQVLELRQSLVKGGVSKSSGKPWNALSVVGFLKTEKGELRAFDDMLFLDNPQPLPPGLYTVEMGLRVRDSHLQPVIVGLVPAGKGA